MKALVRIVFLMSLLVGALSSAKSSIYQLGNATIIGDLVTEGVVNLEVQIENRRASIVSDRTSQSLADELCGVLNLPQRGRFQLTTGGRNQDAVSILKNGNVSIPQPHNGQVVLSSLYCW